MALIDYNDTVLEYYKNFINNNLNFTNIFFTTFFSFIININSLFNNTKSLPIFTTFFLTSAGAYLIIGLLFALINTIKKENNNEHI